MSSNDFLFRNKNSFFFIILLLVIAALCFGNKPNYYNYIPYYLIKTPNGFYGFSQNIYPQSGANNIILLIVIVIIAILLLTNQNSSSSDNE